MLLRDMDHLLHNEQQRIKDMSEQLIELHKEWLPEQFRTDYDNLEEGERKTTCKKLLGADTFDMDTFVVALYD